MIKGGRVTIRTDHKPLLEIVAGTAESQNTEPIVLKEKAEVNMVTTRAKSAEQEQSTLKLLDLQIRVQTFLKHRINAS